MWPTIIFQTKPKIYLSRKSRNFNGNYGLLLKRSILLLHLSFRAYILKINRSLRVASKGFYSYCGLLQYQDHANWLLHQVPSRVQSREMLFSLFEWISNIWWYWKLLWQFHRCRGCVEYAHKMARSSKLVNDVRWSRPIFNRYLVEPKLFLRICLHSKYCVASAKFMEKHKRPIRYRLHSLY